MLLRSAPVGVRPIVLVMSLLVLSSCQKVGVAEAPRATPAAPPPQTVVVPEVSDRPQPRVNGRAPLSETEITLDGIDAILHSPAAKDSHLQEQIAYWKEFWTGRQGDYFGRYLERMGLYVFLVDEALEGRGLPPSLRYLPIVESGYHPTIVSSAGATGMWQIMAPTARDLGLTVSSIVDERRDPVAATHAALDYLETLHGMFDSWFLALAAYNAGPGRVRQIMDRHGPGNGASGDEAFLAIRAHLPAETREFVPRFFAAATLAERLEANMLVQPLAYDEVLIPDATSLDVVARAAGVDEEDIVSLNPQFLRGFTPVGEERVVRVPDGHGDVFDRQFALIPPDERLTILEHVVASGETLSHIARHYRVTVADLTAANAQVDPRRLQIGMRVVVPVPGSGGNGAVHVADATASGTLHQVTRGESLWTIARTYGVTPEALAVANQRGFEDVIRVGDELRIP